MWATPYFGDVPDPLKWVAERLRPGRRSEDLAHRFGYRPYMVERYVNMLGSWREVKELLAAFERRLNPVVRCNTLRIRECGELVRRLKALGYELVRLGWVSYGFEVIGGGVATLGSTHEFLAGLYYLHRGAAALIPPIILEPRAGEVVCDLAAAPGGKLTHMAQLMRNEGALLGVDVSRERMKALRSNVERLGVRNAVLLRADGRLVPEIFPRWFGKVLLDAPCSGEGLIMLDPLRKVRAGFKDLVRLHRLQVELLNAALDSVREGGLVLYSVCSIAPEECELVVSEVVEGRDDVVVEGVRDVLGKPFGEGLGEFLGLTLPECVRRCVRVWPHVHGMEGFFMCLLRRVG